MSKSNRVELSLSPLAKLGALAGGLILLGVLGVLIAVLVTLNDARQEIRTTRIGVVQAEERFERVTRQIDPLLGAAEPLADPAARRRLERAGTRAAGAIGELPELADTAKAGAEAAAFLAGDVRDADLIGTLRSVRSLAETGQAVLAPLAGPELARVVEQTDRRLADLDRPGSLALRPCLTRLQRLAPSAPGQVACLLRLVPNLRSVLLAQLRANRGTLATNKAQLTANRRQLDLFAESIVIQREILERVRSLDRKSGGPAPAAPEPVAPAAP